jgi:LPS-assembly protein
MCRLPADDSTGVAARQANGHAEQIDFQGENQIHLTSATYSTCKPGQTDWYLKSLDTHLDYDRDVADVSQATLWFKEVPIFYAPVASFALNHQRKSGFLHPFSGIDQKRFRLQVPYYWAIAPAERRSTPLHGRAASSSAPRQYLGYNHRGTARSSTCRTCDRKPAALRPTSSISKTRTRLLGDENWNGVSDDRCGRTCLPPAADLADAAAETDGTQLHLLLAADLDPVLRYQTLQPDPASPIARYFLEPQIGMVGTNRTS